MLRNVWFHPSLILFSKISHPVELNLLQNENGVRTCSISAFIMVIGIFSRLLFLPATAVTSLINHSSLPCKVLLDDRLSQRR